MTVCQYFNVKARLLLLVSCLCGATLPLTAEENLRLVLREGKVASARFVSFSDKQMSYTDDESNVVQSVSMKEVVRWGSLVNPTAVDQLLLTDGSILMGRITRVTRDAFVTETDLWGELTVPRSSLQGAIWNLPTDPTEQWKFRDQITSGKGSESLILKNGDAVEGKLLSGNPRFFKILTSTGPLEVKTPVVTAWTQTVVGNKPLTKDMVCGLSDGSQLVTTDLRVNHQIQATLACGLVLGSLPGVQPADERLIRYIRPVHTSFTYLSDLEPIGYKHIPFLKMDWPWQADRNVLQGPLSSSGSEYYAKGLGMHSTSRLAFQLEKDHDEFQAEICLDESAGELGSAVFRVFAFDRQKKWQESFKSSIVRGGDAPLPVRVPLNGATQLALVIDFADRGDVLDRANWLGARVVDK